MEQSSKHTWEPTTDFCVGSLYPYIYPWYCKCGALCKQDGTVLEPEHHCKIEQCPAGKLCSTTRGRPDHMRPEECPLLKNLRMEYPKIKEVPEDARKD